MIGNVASGGLGACGTILQTASQIYSDFSAVAGVVGATQHVIQGTAGFGDALAFLPAVSCGVSQLSGLGGNCFVAGTEVVTAADPAHPGVFSTKPIQDVQVGDEVLTRDQNNPNAPEEERKVVQVFQHTVYSLEDVTITGSDGVSETIRCTPEHPFYVDGQGWTGSSHLTAGEHLVQADGSVATVVSATGEAHPEGVTVYNFEVEGDHTYFVDQGGDAVWVHNSCHIAEFEHFNSNGRLLDSGTIQSGLDIKLGRRLSWAEQAATHTEVKILSLLGPTLKRGHTLIIRGTLPPCRGCGIAMANAAKDTGAVIRYLFAGIETLYKG